MTDDQLVIALNCFLGVWGIFVVTGCFGVGSARYYCNV